MSSAHADVSTLDKLISNENQFEISEYLNNSQPQDQNKEVYFLFFKLLTLKKSNSDEFVFMFNSNIESIEKEGHILLPNFYILFAKYQLSKGDEDLYLNYLIKAKNYSAQHDDYNKLLYLYLDFADFYFEKEKYHLSLSFLNQIAILPEKITDNHTAFRIDLLYGDIYFNLLAYEEADTFYLKVYDLLEKNTFKEIKRENKIYLLYKLSLNKIKLKYFIEANKYINKGINLSKQNKKLLFKFYLLKSQIYYNNSIFGEAKKILEEAESISSEENRDELNLYRFYTFYYEDKHKNSSVLENISFQILSKLENIKEENEEKYKDYFYVIYLYYVSVNKHEEALYYFEKYHKFFKDFFENELQHNISELRDSLENEIQENNLKSNLQKSKTNKLLFEKNLKIKEQQNLIIIVFSIIIIFIIILLVRNIFVKHKLKRYSEIDDLTKVYNRRFTSRMAHKLHDSKNKYSLILFDLDHFKNVNDTYGHQTGDEVLINVCEKTKEFLRSNDYFGRYGGEEFIIFLPDTEIKNAIYIAERIRLEIEKLVFEANSDLNITASFGVNSFNPALTINDVFEITDKRLYKAKNNGRNQVCSKD